MQFKVWAIGNCGKLLVKERNERSTSHGFDVLFK